MANYILHCDNQSPDNGVSIFGPFDGKEMKERLNDAYADALAVSGPIVGLKMDEGDAMQLYINDREYWMTQLAGLE